MVTFTWSYRTHFAGQRERHRRGADDCRAARRPPGQVESCSITNTGSSTVNGWSLLLTIPSGQTTGGGWNASYSPTSGTVPAKNASYNGTLSPGGSTSLGFQATHLGNAAALAASTLSSSSCTIG